MTLRHTSLRPSALVVALAAAAAAAAGPPARVDSAAAQSAQPEGYRLTAQWPIPDASADLVGLLRAPTGLEVAPDGTVFVADAGVGGIHVVTPDGRFLRPLGADSDGPEHIGAPGKLAAGPISAAEGSDWRLYAIDDGADRVVVYASDGSFVAEWPGIDAAGIGVGSDGRVYLADRARSVISIRSPGGVEVGTFGQRGIGPGQLSGMVDLDVAVVAREAGSFDAVAVADLDRLRVQYLTLGAGGLELQRAFDLTARQFQDCPAESVQVIGDELVWASVGTGACILSPAQPERLSLASSRGGGTVCGGLAFPRIRAWRGQFVALGTYDPRPGSCNLKDQRSPLPVTDAVVRFADAELRSVTAVHPALDDRYYDLTLTQPRAMAWRDPGELLVADQWLRRYGDDGVLRRRLPSTTGGGPTVFTVTQVDEPIGGGGADEVFGAFTTGYRSSRTAARRGVGRFRVILQRLRIGGLIEQVEALEAVWSETLDGTTYTYFDSTTRRFGEHGIAFDRGPGSAAIVGLIHDFTDDGVVERLRRWQAADGTFRKSRDVPVAGPAIRPSTIDVAVDAADTAYVLDQYARQVRRWDRAGSPLPAVPVSRDARALAVSPAGQLYVLRESGRVERVAPDGRVLGRLDGRPSASSDPSTLVGLLAGDDGRVYTLDQQSGLVSVFEPGAPEGDATPADASCAFAADKVAAPAQVALGGSVTVTLSLAGRCGIGELPSDIVLVVPQYPPRAVPDPADPIVDELRRVVARIDLARHRVGIVSYFTAAAVELPLTQDADRIDRAIEGIARRPETGAVSRLQGGLAEAFAQLGDATRRRVMLLHHPEYCHPDYHATAAYCRGYVPAEETATAIQGAGIRIAVLVDEAVRVRRYIGGGQWQDSIVRDANHLASSDADVVVDNIQAIYRRLVDYHVPAAPATSLQLTDALPANMPLVPGSPSPAAAVAGGVVTWSVAALDYGTARFALRVTPQDLGRWPTNVEAVAAFTDGWGVPQRIVFPVPQVEVVAPSPTPVAPTQTATATARPTPTVEPTATRVLVPIYLPYAVVAHCLPASRGVDAVLVVDVSSSMAGAKLDAARRALLIFLDQLRLQPEGRDRAAIVAFDGQARVASGLSGDPAALDAAAAALIAGEGTRMDLGIHAALDLLAQRDGDRTPVIVLLSDGRQDDPATALAAGDRARAAAVALFAIGLGSDVDEGLLRALATDAAAYHHAPTADDLAAVYARVGGAVGCR